METAAVTATRVWSEKSPQTRSCFATGVVETFMNDEAFDAKRVDGTIPRRSV